MQVIFPWTVLGRSKPILIVSASIFKVSVMCSVAVTWYMCLTYDMAFLMMLLSHLRKHVVASKQLRNHLIREVPSMVISMRSRLLSRKHQTQWEKYPISANFFSGNSTIGVSRQPESKWNEISHTWLLFYGNYLPFSKDRSLPLGAGRYKTAWQHSMWMHVSNISIANIFYYCCVALSGQQSVPFKYDEYESNNVSNFTLVLLSGERMLIICFNNLIVK